MKTNKESVDDIARMHGIDPSKQFTYKGLDIWNLETNEVMISKEGRILGFAYFETGSWYCKGPDYEFLNAKAPTKIEAIQKAWYDEIL